MVRRSKERLGYRGVGSRVSVWDYERGESILQHQMVDTIVC